MGILEWLLPPEESASVQQGTREQVNGDLVVVSSSGSEPGQVGSALVLASRIEAAKADHQITQGGQVFGCVSGAHRREIFPEGDIAHVVEGILDRPVASTESLQLSGVHLSGRATGDHDFGFLGNAKGFEVMSGAGNDGGLDGMREPGGLRGDFEGTNLTGFMPAVTLVQSEVRRGKKRLSAPWKAGRVFGRAWVDCL